jgi:hypothetical protein
MNRAVGAERLAGDGGDPFAEGYAPAGNGKRGGFEYNCSCVLSGKHSCMTTKPRCEPHLPSFLPGLRTRSRHSRASAKPANLTLRRQSVVRGLRRDGCMGAIGRPARSLAAKCQTNLVLSVRSAIFPGGETERQRSVASGKWPCSRLLPMSWPGEASRPLASCFPGRTLRFCLSRQFAAVGTRQRSGAGAKLASQADFPSRARVERCRYLARGEWFGARAWPRPSASVGSVKPGIEILVLRTNLTTLPHPGLFPPAGAGRRG